MGIDCINILNLSLLAVSWTKINYYNNELQNKLVEFLLDIKDTINYENIQEISKILWSLSESDYHNEDLIIFLENYLKSEIDNLSANNLLDILMSIGFTYNNNKELIAFLLEVIKNLLNK